MTQSYSEWPQYAAVRPPRTLEMTPEKGQHVSAAFLVNQLALGFHVLYLFLTGAVRGRALIFENCSERALLNRGGEVRTFATAWGAVGSLEGTLTL